MSNGTLFLTRRQLIVGSSVFGALALSACSTTTVLSPAGEGDVRDMTEAALPLVNALRAKRGLPKLSADRNAAQAARDHAARMSQYGKMSHYVGNDRSFLERMKRQGVELPAAENIAAGQDTVEAAVQAWIDSRKHLENMLGPYRGLGVAVARNDGTGRRPYWAMVLSNPDTGFGFRI